MAARLGLEPDEAMWPQLVDAARFEQMQARADRLVPDAVGVVKDPARFFRRGTSGAGRELLSPEELAHYLARAEQLAPADLLAWLHR